MNAANRPLRVGIVGAGPAGIYAADALMKSDAPAGFDGVSIDLYERMPAPFGLIRYGVAPDHPRIKGIITALHKVLDKPQVRLLGNIDYGVDITLDDLRGFYDAVIFSTGANADRALDIPGIDLDGSYGAADFVSWYDGHPDVPRTWPLDAQKVAVLGVGNVALDVARVLAKTGDELLPTEIPPNVYEGLKANQALEVHVFGRRGPAQAKFTPLELRELDHSPTIEVIVDPSDIDYDEGSEAARRHSKQVDMICNTLEQWAIRDVGDRPHKLFLHFFESPAEILGSGGKVVGLRTERTQLDGTGNCKGTGEYKDWDIQAVYRAVGYLSQNIPALPFDEQAGTVPNEAGRVLVDEDADGAARYLPQTYVTGWIKRGPVGLIGHTKGDANETIACLLDDVKDFTPAANPDPEAVTAFLEDKGIPFTTWAGWYRLDAHERALGEPEGRERVKVVEREDMLRASGVAVAPAVETAAILGALAGVHDPEINRPITELDMVAGVDIAPGNRVTVRVLLTVAGCPMRARLTRDIEAAVLSVPGTASVTVDFGVMTDTQRATLRQRLRGGDTPVIPFAQPGNRTRVYALASGKGGVGKSSVTVNLATVLARRGLRVGILDADIHGHSIPSMMGSTATPTQVDRMIMPPTAHGVRLISIAMFVSDNEPVVWRGPMLHRVLNQFLADVYWSDLDVLLIDLPPGTGDIAISLAQLLPTAEMIVVTTPQHTAARIAERAGAVATQTGQRVAGVIENMSWYEGPDGTRHLLFGSGGAEDVSARLTDILGADCPVLARIPLDPDVCAAGDEGIPMVVTHPESAAAQAISVLADRLDARRTRLAGQRFAVAPV